MTQPNWKRLEAERQRKAQELYDSQVHESDDRRCAGCGSIIPPGQRRQAGAAPFGMAVCQSCYVDGRIEDDDDYGDEPLCNDCGGDGWVDSVSEATGRRGWDTDGPGRCPNCRGSGLRKDCTTF